MIELDMPAGSLETALTAFKSGADAIYFGLKEFSARKGAVNFSFDDLSKIRRFSLDNGKRTYITVNTLIDDRAIDRVLPILEQIEFYGTDGIIIQDVGTASIIKRYFPSIPLHGSTQLAVHTADGVCAMQDLGFERVVLSRELSLREIERIRQDCPDVELKAFIHGALCYGFSGLCSASFIKCGRSANGGECAQICRSWFTDRSDGRNGYFFSMQDMDAGERILELDRMGVESAKVEGRLKSPEYVAACTRYYRTILDTGRVDIRDQDDIATTFQRSHGTGYFDYKPNRPSLLSGNYPGHMGLYCGRVTRQGNGLILIDSEVDIESHDGLQYFVENSDGLLKPVQFSANVIRNDRSGITVRANINDSIVGKNIYKISDSTNREKTLSTNIAPFRKPVDIEVVLGPSSISATALGQTVCTDIALQGARNEVAPSETVRKHFCESGDSRYTLGELTFTNNSGFEFPFLAPSVMKSFRRDFYSMLDSYSCPAPVIDQPARLERPFITLPNRNLLRSDLPCSLTPVEIGDRAYFTLPPVTFDEQSTLKALDEAVSSYNGGKKVTIGLNNIAQVRYAKAHEQYDYFVDVFLYLSNRFTASVLAQQVKTLVGGYLWFERQSFDGQWPFTPTVVKDFEMPSFISRTCFRHDARGESCTGCRRHYDYTINQAQTDYTVKVRNCITVVTRKV